MAENKEVQKDQELSDKEIEAALNDIRETIDGDGEKPNTEVLELTDVVEESQSGEGLQISEEDMKAAVEDSKNSEDIDLPNSSHNDLMDEMGKSISDQNNDLGNEDKSAEENSETPTAENVVEQPASGDGATDNGEDQSAENSSEEAATDSNPGTEEVAQAAENSEETKQDIEEENPGAANVSPTATEEVGTESDEAAEKADPKMEAMSKMSDIADNVQNVVAENEKRDNLLDENTASESKDALRDIVKMANKPNVNSVKFRSGTSIEDIVSEIMRPMLQEWLNDNLAELVKKTVEREIRRLVPQEDEE
jgi:cell pole-organizing protein PopZ